MIANQLVTCEECLDASCKKCKAFIRRQRRKAAAKNKFASLPVKGKVPS